MAEPTLHEKRPDAEVVEYVDAEAIGDAPWTNAGTHTDDVRDVLASLDRDPQRVYRVAVDLYVVDRRGDLVALPRPEWRYDADAREWSAAHDLATAWRDCRDARWMLNAVADVVPRQSLVLAACACARTVLHLVPAGETRPLRAIEVAEAWCRGEATLDEVRAAATLTAVPFRPEKWGFRSVARTMPTRWQSSSVLERQWTRNVSRVTGNLAARVGEHLWFR